MNNKKTFTQYFIFIIGLVFFGLGLSFINKSFFGSNPMGVFVSGLSITLVISFGTANLLVNAFQIVIGYALDKVNVTLASLMSMFLGSYMIDLAALLIPDSNSLFVRIIYMLLGIFFYCLSIAVQQHAQCGYGALDCFIFGLRKLFKIKQYYHIRWIVDGLFLVLGFILHGVVNIGTLILVAFSGLIIQNLKKIIDKLSIGRWKDWE